MNRICTLLALLALTASLPGCAANKLAWEHYDACLAENPKFVDMVACGKRNRTAYCEENPRKCGGNGAAMVAYADSLSQSVERREMTEAQAMRDWIAFKSQERHRVAVESAAEDAAAASRSAAVAASKPVHCSRIGNSVSCF